MQDRAHASFFGGADRPVEQQEDVDVRLQTQLPPSVAAERDDEAGAAGAGGFVEQPLQEVVDAVRELLERGAPTLSTRRGRGQRVAGAFDAGERRRHLIAAAGMATKTRRHEKDQHCFVLSCFRGWRESTLDHLRTTRPEPEATTAHEIGIDAARAAPAVGDRPDDERLAALHVAGREDARDVRHPVRIAGDGAALGQRNPQLARSGRSARARRIPSPAARGPRRTRSAPWCRRSVAWRRATRPSAVPAKRSVAIA